VSIGNIIALVIVIGFALIVGYLVVTHFFSEAARQERRRRRSNRRITSKSKRPMVKFSVRTKKQKD